MNKNPAWYTVGLVGATALLVAALVYVEFRSRRLEWVAFQEKGLALAVERLENELAS